MAKTKKGPELDEGSVVDQEPGQDAVGRLRFAAPPTRQGDILVPIDGLGDTDVCADDDLAIDVDDIEGELARSAQKQGDGGRDYVYQKYRHAILRDVYEDIKSRLYYKFKADPPEEKKLTEAMVEALVREDKDYIRARDAVRKAELQLGYLEDRMYKLRSRHESLIEIAKEQRQKRAFNLAKDRANDDDEDLGANLPR